MLTLVCSVWGTKQFMMAGAGCDEGVMAALSACITGPGSFCVRDVSAHCFRLSAVATRASITSKHHMHNFVNITQNNVAASSLSSHNSQK